MEKNELYQNKYRTKTVRLKHHDYTHGMYFVTICVNQFKCIFGDIINGIMKLNQWGKIVKTEWQKTEEIRNNVELDEFVIMPNHFHGIISIKDIENGKDMAGRASMNSHGRDVARYVSTDINEKMKQISPKKNSLASVIRNFKSSCTREIRKAGLTAFKWQPRFYDHIVKDDRDYQNIQTYIYENPQKWQNDKYFSN